MTFRYEDSVNSSTNPSSSFDKELECKLSQFSDPPPESGSSSPQYCLRQWDSLLCWPPTKNGSLAIVPCFGEMNGIQYDTSQNASKWCNSNGTWDIANYSLCEIIERVSQDDQYEATGIETTTMIYSVGYVLSLVVLLIAVWIFVYFKDLRCLRNKIHTNLMCTYILADFMWIVMKSWLMTVQSSYQSNLACVILFSLHYCHLTNFFWMFVEGLYLYMLVVETFSSANIKLRVYFIIGWGAPLVIITVWAIVKTFAPSTDMQSQGMGDVGLRNCQWMTPQVYDYIYQVPAILVLGINSIFLIMIMWVLITKLRSANTVETQQYRKATKALVVLIPLLGITYILVIWGPTDGPYANLYAHLRAILLSTQGFTVALFYCFLNTEVQNTLRHHLERWKEARNLGAGGRRCTCSRDWSPNTRTESIRLYSAHHIALTSGHFNKKRESTTSDITTMTLVGGNGAGGGLARHSNGSTNVTCGRKVSSCLLDAPITENTV
uniref:Diuretic hormone receptor n=1 Tax=Cacopsylla melanoneura TaxID=428564 RepID=A0A8D9DY41_9HEMI